MKKILLVISEAFRRDGGIQQYNRLLCKAASDYANAHYAQVRILSRNDRPEDASNFYVYGPNVAFNGFNGQLRKFVTCVLRAAMEVRPDITLLCLVNFAALGPILRTLGLTKQYCVALYGIEAWRCLPCVQRWGLRQADFVLSISEYTRRQTAMLNGLAIEKIHILQPVLDPSWSKGTNSCSEAVSKSKRHYTLLSVARLDANERYKGIDQVIRALSQITAEVGDLRYVIVGNGTDRPRLENLARSLDVSDKVQFLGHVAPDALKQLYAECDLFVMPSLNEGFGIVFLEAMSYGKAVIGGRHGGTPEIVVEEETGVLVDHHNLPELAVAIIRLLQDVEKRSRMGKAGLARLQEKFTYPSFRNRFFTILESQLMDNLRQPFKGDK